MNDPNNKHLNNNIQPKYGTHVDPMTQPLQPSKRPRAMPLLVPGRSVWLLEKHMFLLFKTILKLISGSAESGSSSRSLFYRIFLTRTGIHFA
jgi:hypothetical protein